MSHQEKCSHWWVVGNYLNGDIMCEKKPENEFEDFFREIFENHLKRDADVVEENKGENMRISEIARFNEEGMMVRPPVKPLPLDTSSWKRITPKRRELMANHREAMRKYYEDLEHFESLPVFKANKREALLTMERKPLHDPVNHRTYYDYLNGVFDPEVPVLRYFAKGFGECSFTAFPVRKTELEIVEIDPENPGMWLDDLIDPVWRREEHERERAEYRQSRQKFFRARDTTVQLDLYSNNYRDITKDVLHTFETDPNPELAMNYVLALVDKYRPCIHGTVNIPSIYILLTPSERDEIDRRAEMVRG